MNKFIELNSNELTFVAGGGWISEHPIASLMIGTIGAGVVIVSLSATGYITVPAVIAVGSYRLISKVELMDFHKMITDIREYDAANSFLDMCKIKRIKRD